MEKYSFSPTPLSVYTGNFNLMTKFKVSATALPGPVVITGKLQLSGLQRPHVPDAQNHRRLDSHRPDQMKLS